MEKVTNPARKNLHLAHLVALTLVVSVVDVGAPKNGARAAGMDEGVLPPDGVIVQMI